MLGNFSAVVVATAFGGTVTNVVLGTGGHGVGGFQICALVASNVRSRNHTAEVGVFACAFDHAAPPRVASDIDHRGEGPANPGGRTFLGGYACRFFDNLRIPGGCQAERNGKLGAVSVDDV